MKIILLSIAILVFCSSSSLAQIDLVNHKAGIWSIAGTSDKTRWIIIHNLEEAQETGIFHIELIARKIGDPLWKIEHEVKHMAITQPALAVSVIKPLDKGFVYPETFDDAFLEWQKENSGKGGEVCSTSIKECTKNNG